MEPKRRMKATAPETGRGSCARSLRAQTLVHHPQEQVQGRALEVGVGAELVSDDAVRVVAFRRQH